MPFATQRPYALAVLLKRRAAVAGERLQPDPQGHMFAGWITFSAAQVDDQTVAQAQVLMRASDPIYEVGLTLGGHRQEDLFWNRTLASLAAHFEHDCVVETNVVCVDRRRQWSRWRNVWQSAAIRTTVYTLAAPGRKLRRRPRGL